MKKHPHPPVEHPHAAAAPAEPASDNACCCGNCACDDAPEAPAAQPQADVAALQAEVAALKDQYLRAQADVQNARRRAEEEVAKARKFGIENFAESLLPVLDSLDAALLVPSATAEQLREGTQATQRQLLAALERNKVVVVHPGQGHKFDPHQHQAISVAPAPEGVELPTGSILSVLQKGYLIAERVLRPALVVVVSE